LESYKNHVKVLQSEEGLRNLIITSHHKLIRTIYNIPQIGDILPDMMYVEAIEFHIYNTYKVHPH
jgi:hypothetical protein